MKILFYVKGTADAYLARALAQLFKDRGIASDFAAVAYREAGEGDVLRRTPGNLFSRILTESEMVSAAAESKPDPALLERLEAEYGVPTLWQYVTQDRWLSWTRRGSLFDFGTSYTRDHLLTQIQTRLTMTEQLLQEFAPDIVVYAGYDVGPSSALILAGVAGARRMPILVPKNAKIGSLYVVSNSVFSRMPRVETMYHELRAGAPNPEYERAVALLADFRKDKAITLAARTKTKPRSTQALHPKRLPGQVAKYYRKLRSGDPLYASWLRRQQDKLTIRMRRMAAQRMLDADALGRGEPFVYFPLHLEPEMSLQLYAPFYTNQFALIQNVAQSLPQDLSLYVKEHPRAFGKRPINYYEQLARIPNVRFLDPKIKSLDLIRQSRGVVTIAGTVGIEAMLLNKPVITVGEVFYNFADELVYHMKAFDELPVLLKRFTQFESNEPAVLDVLSALLSEAIDLDLNALAAEVLAAPTELANPRLGAYTDYLIRRIQEPSYVIPSRLDPVA